MGTVSTRLMLRSRKTSDGYYTLLLRIMRDKKRVFVTTDLKLKKYQFNQKSQSIVRHPLKDRYNVYLEKMLNRITDILLDAQANGKYLSARQIKEIFLGRKSSVYEFMEQRIADFYKKEKVSEYKNWKSALNIAKEFDQEGPTFGTIDSAWIKRFINYCEVERGNKSKSVDKKLNILRRVYNQAIEFGYADSATNPFDKIRYKAQTETKDRLTASDIKDIKNIDYSNHKYPSRGLYRDIFMFCFYNRGMRINEALKLVSANFDTSNEVLDYVMSKNNRRVIVPLTSFTLEMYKRYVTNDHKPNDFVFPILSRGNITNYNSQHDLLQDVSSKTAFINKKLKIIAKDAGLSKKITTHSARHAYLDIADSLNIQAQTIQDLANHSKFETTRSYIQHQKQEKVNRAHNTILDAVEDKDST